MCPLRSHPEDLEVDFLNTLAYALLSPQDTLLPCPHHSALRGQALCWEPGGTLWPRSSCRSPACSPAPHISSLPSSNLNKHLFSALRTTARRQGHRQAMPSGGSHSLVGVGELTNVNQARASPHGQAGPCGQSSH